MMKYKLEPIPNGNNYADIRRQLEAIRRNDTRVVSGLHIYVYHEAVGEHSSSSTSSSKALGENILLHLFEAIAENTSVIELDLTENMRFIYSKKAFPALIQALQKNQTIETLILSQNVFAKNYSLYSRKKHLSSSWEHDFFEDVDFKFSKKHLDVFIEGLEELVSIKRLKKLDLSGNRLTATHIEGMCRSLRDSNLEVLNLSKNKLKDEGVRMVLAALVNHHSLKELIIHRNGISKALLKEIPSLVEQISMLKHIELGTKLKLPWNKAIRKDIDRKIEEHDGQLAFFQACNFLLMHWWREKNSPKSASPLSALKAKVIICMLMQLRDVYQKTVPDKVIKARRREFIKEKNDTLYWNAFPEDELKKPKTKKLTSIKAEQRTGVYNYALTANGQLFFGKKFDAPGGRHIDLVNGCPVRCAGEMRFEKGEMKEYDNASRHYTPSPKQTKKEMTFFLNAANEKPVKFVSKKWVEDAGHENGGEWLRAKI